MSIESPTPLTYSQEWWRVTLSSIGDGVIVTDRFGNIDFMNPVAEALTSWTNAEAKGKAIGEIFRIINETTRTPVENPVGKVIESGIGAALANHTVLLARNGSQVFIDDSAAPIKSDDGKIFGAVLVFRDIAEKKRAQEAQLRLAAIIESSRDAILSESMEGIILTWNRGAEAIYGYKPAEIIGQHISVLVPVERAEEMSMIMSRTRRGEAIEHFETVHRRRDGKLIDVSLTVSPIIDEEGQTIGISRIVRDVTEKKEAETGRAYLAAIVDCPTTLLSAKP